MTRILFVDDERCILDGLRRSLRFVAPDWQMHFAETGQAALEVLGRQPMDVIVSDMRMPGMDGAALLAAVRAHYPHIVRIILSGHSDHAMTLRSVGTAHQCLAKPCEATDLKNTIDRTCALRALLRNEQVARVVGGAESLPSLPVHFMQLQEEIHSPEPSIRRIGRIIEQDVGMMGKVLQLVNSAFFGLRRHVESPAEAAKLLGTETISALALTMGVFEQFANSAFARQWAQRVTQHSMNVAAWARAICRTEEAKHTVADHAFLAGMLHDAGKLLLASSYEKECREVQALVANGMTELAAENEVHGATHAAVGGCLFGLWGLPDPLVEAVAFHHAPSEAPLKEFGPLAVVHVANVLERRRADWAPPETDEMDYLYLADAGLTQKLPAWGELEPAGQCVVKA